eukprot:CAMPEP_0170492636 /NCGR_PEP_ID=MMETSP0208-20121228/12545_1 /TAXON_ID=197538 /ORGANISM="Strombidium inclinatum, Strain S3" /LENGTH=77 /DNA_ID=CAMNT_0010768409 /DNA_START=42 /DNA_END=275 /DNA_ORIENTATION=-
MTEPSLCPTPGGEDCNTQDAWFTIELLRTQYHNSEQLKHDFSLVLYGVAFWSLFYQVVKQVPLPSELRIDGKVPSTK